MTRQEAIETIQTAIAQVEWDYPMDYTVALDKAVEALAQPEIVPCKDCRFKDCEGREGFIVCDITGESHKPDFFCAYGERMDGDG